VNLAQRDVTQSDRRRKRPTSKNVAEHARVSASTMSYVLNDFGSVTPERRNRMMDRVHPTLSVVAWLVGGPAALVMSPCWSRAGPTAPRDGRSPGHPQRPVPRRAGIAPAHRAFGQMA